MTKTNLTLSNKVSRRDYNFYDTRLWKIFGLRRLQGFIEVDAKSFG